MIRAACCPAIMAFLLVFLGISAIRVQAQPASGNATAMMRERSPVAAVHTGPTIAIIYDMLSGTTNTASVPGDEIRLPNIGDTSMNPVLIEVPVRPGHSTFAKIVFNDGFCSGTAIGRRLFLTAGHCVYDRESQPGGFRKSAMVYPGYSLGQSRGEFKARRFIAFNGWTASGDYAHDIALVEIDTDLPADIAMLELSSDAYACGPNGAFDRHYYKGGSDYQLRVSAPHVGCRDSQYFWAIGTWKGSSGSAAVRTGTNQVYGVYSNFATNPVALGFDAPLTAGKICFIRNNYLGGACQPPENVGPVRVSLETSRREVIQGVAFVDLVVNRHGNPSGVTQIAYDTVSMTALEGRDFRRAQGALSWGAGDSAPQVVRVAIIPPEDPGCEREFGLRLMHRAGDAEILGESQTTVGIISASRPAEEKQLVMKQLVVRMDTEPGLPALSLLHAPAGDGVVTNRGYTFATFWRDRQRGTLRFQRVLQDQLGGYTSVPSMSPDGRHVIRLADAQVQVFARQGSTLTKINGLGFDYDRYTQYDITQSPDARADVYISALNTTTRRPGILRYQHDPQTGALTDKRLVRAGEGGLPNVQAIGAIRVSNDGRVLAAIGGQPSALMTFRRAADGTLQFIQADTQSFGPYQPSQLVLTPDSNFAFVIASAANNATRLFTYLIGPQDIAILPTMDLPRVGTSAVSPDGKALYLSGGERPWLYKYAIDGSSVRLVGRYDPQRCIAKPELNFGFGQVSVSPDSRYVMLGLSERAIVVLEHAN